MAKKRSVGKPARRDGQTPLGHQDAGRTLSRRVKDDPKLAASIAKLKSGLSDPAARARFEDIQNNTERTIGELTTFSAVQDIKAAPAMVNGYVQELIASHRKEHQSLAQNSIADMEHAQAETAILLADLVRESHEAIDSELDKNGLPSGTEYSRKLGVMAILEISEDEYESLTVHEIVTAMRITHLREKWMARLKAEADAGLSEKLPTKANASIECLGLSLSTDNVLTSCDTLGREISIPPKPAKLLRVLMSAGGNEIGDTGKRSLKCGDRWERDAWSAAKQELKSLLQPFGKTISGNRIDAWKITETT